MPPRLTVAHTPDTDDAFYYRALVDRRFPDLGIEFEFLTDHIHHLNGQAAHGRHDVTAVSSVSFGRPEIWQNYRILEVGTSVGRGYGPVLAARDETRLGDLAGLRVGVAGLRTTGGVLLALAQPECERVVTDYTEMARRIHDGSLDAAVLIHEELLRVEEHGLVPVLDLGGWWCRTRGLPLPVGLNLIHRRVPRQVAQEVARAFQRSIRYGLEHPDETLLGVSHFSRRHSEEFVEMFANEDSESMRADVRLALEVLLREVAEIGLGDPRAVEAIDIVEVPRGAPPSPARASGTEGAFL